MVWPFNMILVGFLLLHRDAVFTSVRFFLIGNVSHGTWTLALSLVGMHSAAASMWTLTMFSYSLFGESVSDISWSGSNFFLSVNVYLSLITLLLSSNQSVWNCDSVIGGNTLKRGIWLTIQWAIVPFLIYENVVYLCFSIICVGVGPYFSTFRNLRRHKIN